MLAALLAVAIQPSQYQATLICAVPAKAMSSFIYCAVLTDQKTVAGYTCTSVGHHGETFFGKPFVWSKGKLHKLPLPPEAEYGHVRGGNDQLLLGSVAIDYRDRPAIWTADPHLGWAKPQLKIISMKEGYATHIGPDAAVWIQTDNAVTRRLHHNKLEETPMGRFVLEGIDGQGRLFGNRFTSITFGNRPNGTTPGLYQGGVWTQLKLQKPHPELGFESYAQAVNSSGVVTGNCQNQAVIWKDGDVSLFLNGKKRWSFANGINDSGAVVGRCAVEDIHKSMPFLWRHGKLTDLSKAVPGQELESAVKINSHGVIAVIGRTNRTAKLYLLRPK